MPQLMTLPQAVALANQRARKHDREYLVYRDPDAYTDNYQVCSYDSWANGGELCYLYPTDLEYSTSEGYYR